MFQSFWFNGLLWKSMLSIPSVDTSVVSILLGQWITLEAIPPSVRPPEARCFNPSGSMDYFGRRGVFQANTVETEFQSFWVNGLLWKIVCVVEDISQSSEVSILLGQWITLEESYGNAPLQAYPCFNPSGSMDYFGSETTQHELEIAAMFQSFWVNGLLWKVTIRTATEGAGSVSILLGQWITLEERQE